MEEKVYLGMQYGRFEDRESGREINYMHGFFFSPFGVSNNPDRHTYGYQPEKLRLQSLEVVQGLEPLDKVIVYFGRNSVVTKVEKVSK